jgi:hypothetical protein
VLDKLRNVIYQGYKAYYPKYTHYANHIFHGLFGRHVHDKDFVIKFLENKSALIFVSPKEDRPMGLALISRKILRAKDVNKKEHRVDKLALTDFLISVQFQGYGEDTFSVNSLFLHEGDEKKKIREEINAKIVSDHPNATIPNPSVYKVTGIDAFVFEEENIFAEDEWPNHLMRYLIILAQKLDVIICRQEPMECNHKSTECLKSSPIEIN